MAAATATLDTGELLELILLNLDTRTLLLSQRVDRRWHYIIRHSKMLQKKLFLLPTNTFDEILELGLLDAAKSERYNILDATSHRSKQFLEHIVILNDLLFDTTREWKLRNVAFADPAKRSGSNSNSNNNSNNNHDHPHNTTNNNTNTNTMTFIPSWQRMLLTQPPPSTGKGDVMFWFEDAHDHDELCEGVNTLGDMMQKIYVKEASLTGFDVDWKSAAVRPVKHAVDGTYYMKLLAQRQRDCDVAAKQEEEEMLLLQKKKKRGRGRNRGGMGAVGQSRERFEEFFEEEIPRGGFYGGNGDGNDEVMNTTTITVATHDDATWPCEGAEFAML